MNAHTLRASQASCAVFMMIPSLTDPSLAPPGQHVVIIQAFGARESGETRPDDPRIADQLLELAEEQLPGLRDHLTFIEPGQNAQQPKAHRLGPIYELEAVPCPDLPATTSAADTH